MASLKVSITVLVDEFLSSTNQTYDECSKGISDLDRIIVASPTLLTAQCRMALVPALYAYWERFFRLALSEYVRCIHMAEVPLENLSEPLARLVLGREVRERIDVRLSEALHRTIREEGASGFAARAQGLLQTASALCSLATGVAIFPSPETWIDTDSNVSFKMVEKNCERLGLNLARLRGKFEQSQVSLYSALKDLVDTRNGIAHGESLSAMGAHNWNTLKESALLAMNALQEELRESLEVGLFMRAATS
jgi:hypothetical protein